MTYREILELNSCWFNNFEFKSNLSTIPVDIISFWRVETPSWTDTWMTSSASFSSAMLDSPSADWSMEWPNALRPNLSMTRYAGGTYLWYFVFSIFKFHQKLDVHELTPLTSCFCTVTELQGRQCWTAGLSLKFSGAGTGANSGQHELGGHKQGAGVGVVKTGNGLGNTMMYMLIYIWMYGVGECKCSFMFI